MAIKIIVSDVSSGHANSMESNILAICPTATIEKRIESIDASVTYALSASFNGICRATTGLDDARIQGAGDTANSGGVWIVHAHKDNTNTRYTDPSYIGSIIIARGNSTSYGLGAEFTVDTGTESDATSNLTGMVAQILTVSSSWGINEARQALRETANSWSVGWSEEVGFGVVDWQAALSGSEYGDINSIGNIVNDVSVPGTLNSTFNTFYTASTGYTASLYTSSFNPINIVAENGTIIYKGSENSFTYNHSLLGTYYLGYFHQNSRLESFSTASVTLTYIGVKISGVGTIKFHGSGGSIKIY